MANMQAAAGAQLLREMGAAHFRTFDKNGDGQLNFEELSAAITSMYQELGQPAPPERKIRQAMSIFDYDHSGTLSLDQFLDCFAATKMEVRKPPMPPPFEQANSQALMLFDSIAKNGRVSKADFVMTAQTMIKPMLQMPLQMIAMPFGPCGPDGPKVLPAAQRAVQALDMNAVGKICELIFPVLDVNGDGSLSRDEVQGLFNMVTDIATGGPDPSKIIEPFFRLVDKNGDGVLSVEEAQFLVPALLDIVCCAARSGLEVADSLITSSEVVSVLVEKVNQSPLMMMDENGDGVISKKEFEKFLKDSPVGPMMAQAEAMLGSQQGQLQAFVDQLKQARTAMAAMEGGITNKLIMKAMEWSRTGVDEATFLSHMIPLLREQQENVTVEARADLMMTQFQNSEQQMTQQFAAIGIPVPPPMAMMFAVYKTPAFKESMKKVLGVAKEKAVEVIPEMARQIFRLIDLDNSGSVSVREITVLKAVMDGLLRFGTLSLVKGGAEIPPEEKTQLNHMYPDLLLMDALGQPPTLELEMKQLLMAIFDAVDRDGDGNLEREELVGFVVKVASFFINSAKSAITVYTSVLGETSKELIASLWKMMMPQLQAQGKVGDGISKEEVPMLMMAVPMMASTMFGGMQG